MPVVIKNNNKTFNDDMMFNHYKTSHHVLQIKFFHHPTVT